MYLMMKDVCRDYENGAVITKALDHVILSIDNLHALEADIIIVDHRIS